MSLHDYHLLAQRGSGPDGICYTAQRTVDGRAVILHLLTLARDHAERWAALTRRLQICGLLQTPHVLRIEEVGLRQEPPFVVLDQANFVPLTQYLQEQPLGSIAAAFAVSLALAETLSQAHAVGLTHGHLTPETVFCRTDGAIGLDFAALRTSTDNSTETSDPMADIHALGQVLRWLWGNAKSVAQVSETGTEFSM